MNDKSLEPPPEAMDYMQKGETFFDAARKFAECHYSYWGLKSAFGFCSQEKDALISSEEALKEAEKRLPPLGPKP